MRLTPDAVLPRLRGSFGREYAWAEEAGSTQRMLTPDAAHGSVAVAEHQTEGRGRLGRVWVDEPGAGLTFSVALHPPPPVARWPELTVVAARAVAAAIGPEAEIKEPNDVLVGGRKVAGVLVEGRPQEAWVVLGIGVNVAVAQDDLPPELQAIATSLGRPPADVEPLLALLLDRLAHWLAAAPHDAMESYRARDALAGREISWSGGHGTALGVADDGRLRVRPAASGEDGDELLLDAGEVHLGSGRGR